MISIYLLLYLFCQFLSLFNFTSSLLLKNKMTDSSDLKYSDLIGRTSLQKSLGIHRFQHFVGSSFILGRQKEKTRNESDEIQTWDCKKDSFPEQENNQSNLIKHIYFINKHRELFQTHGVTLSLWNFNYFFPIFIPRPHRVLLVCVSRSTSFVFRQSCRKLKFQWTLLLLRFPQIKSHLNQIKSS